MATTIAAVSIQVSANPSGAVAGLRQAQNALIQFESTTRGVMDRVKGYLAALAIGKGLQVSVAASASLEKYQVAFQGLIGDVKEGTKLFNDLWEFQKSSPLDIQTLSNATKRLLGMGIEADKVIGVISQLSDVAQGNAETFDLLALVYGQIQSAGRLMGQDLNQISTHFNILKQLTKMTGMQFAELKTAMKEGAITAEMVAAAFEAATQSGGIFFRATENYMKTTEGKWVNFKKQVMLLAIAFGDILMPAVKRTLAILTAMSSTIGSMTTLFSSSTIKIMAWVISVSGIVLIAGRVVDAIRKITIAVRALTLAQVVAQAMSPKGLAMIGVGLVAAVSTAYALDKLFANMDRAVASVGGGTQNVKEDLDELFKPLQKFKGAADEVDESLEKAEKSAEKLHESLVRKGEQLRESLRTPIEIMEESIQEALDLFQSGFIQIETFQRAVMKAREDFNATLKDKRKSLQPEKGIAAVTFGTTAGFSAVEEAKRTASAVNAQLVVQQKQLAEQKKANAVLEKISRNTERPFIELKTVGL